MRQVILFVCQCAVWLPVHVLSKLGDCVTGLLGVGQEWAQLWVCVKRSPGGLVLLWLLQARAQEHTVIYNMSRSCTVGWTENTQKPNFFEKWKNPSKIRNLKMV